MTNSADPDQLASEPTDLDLHCFHRQRMPGLGRTRFKEHDIDIVNFPFSDGDLLCYQIN